MDTVTYKGDHVASLHNRVLGPDSEGKFYAVTEATFANDETTAQLRPVTDEEYGKAKWSKEGFLYLDEA